MLKKGLLVCFTLTVAAGISNAQPFPVGDAKSVPVDFSQDQRQSGVAVNKDGVVFVAYENTGETGEWDLRAALSPDWENWTEVVIISRPERDSDPKVAADPVTGNFAVTWYDRGGADGDDNGEWFRIFQPNGTPVTDAISVSADYTPPGGGGQGWGSCAYNPVNGNLYVLNEDWGGGSAGLPSPDGDGDAQVLRVFDGTTGTKAAGPIVINEDGNGNQDDGFLAFAGDGSFVGVWREYGGDDRIWMGLFDKDMNRIGEEIDVSIDNEIAFFVQDPNITRQTDGRFAVVYTETKDGADGDGVGVFFTLYDKDGSILMKEQQVNQFFTANQEDPEISMDFDTGRFVVVWEDRGGVDGDDFAAMCRAFNADGTPMGDEFIVNSITAGRQDNASVWVLPQSAAANAGFDFVVSFDDESGNDGDGRGVYARRFTFEETTASVHSWMLQ